MTARWTWLPDVDPLPIDVLAPLLALQGATTVPEAVSLAIDAIEAGATAEQAQQALDEWAGLRASQVQQLFASRPRRDCCTGIERQHSNKTGIEP